MGDIIFTRPDKFNGNGGQPCLDAFFGNDPCDLRNFDIVFAVQAATETTTGTNQMHGDIGWRYPCGRRRIGKSRNLTRGPDLQLAILKMSR